MADIRRQGCEEPWDAHHLRYDAIHETPIPEEDGRHLDGRLTSPLHRQFTAAGYRCGRTLYARPSSPCCPTPAPSTPRGDRRGVLTEIAAELLGEDLDGHCAGIPNLSL